MRVAVMALQGAFAEHVDMLERLGVESMLIRNLDDWRHFVEWAGDDAGLIIPGGESTAMMRIMRDEALVEPLRSAVLSGMPVLGTCAGLIMLDREHLATMDIKVRRNAYGRQLGSFVSKSPMLVDGREQDVEMVFIRAPYIEDAGPEVEVLAELDGHIVAARQGRQLVTAFHPELTDDTTIHRMFLKG